MKQGYEIQAKGDAATIYLYGGINQPDDDGYLIDAEVFKAELAQVSAPAIDVRISSIGGDPVAAADMFQALVEHPAKVHTIVDSKAYSAGSMILQAGDKRSAKPMTTIMVHAPAMSGTLKRATAKAHREVAEILEAHADAIVPAYTRHGIPEATVRDWFEQDKDLFFSAEAARDVGLIDEVIESPPIAASAPGAYRIAAMGGKHETADDTGRQRESHTMADKEESRQGVANSDVVAQHSKTVQAAQAAGAKGEAKRRAAVQAVFADFYTGDELDPVSAVYDACLADLGCGELEARGELLKCLKSRTSNPVVAREQYGLQQPTTSPPGASSHLGGASITADHADKLSAGIETALMVKCGLEKDPAIVADVRASGFMAKSLLEMGRDSLRANGHDVTNVADNMQMAHRILAAHSSSDFTNVLANIANKSAMVGYNEAPETWRQWCRVGNLTDFRQAKRVTTSAFPDLDKIPENGEYKYATISDVGEPIQLGTYGKKFRISRQAIVNDDLNAFSEIPRKMGLAAARTPGNLAYAVLTANAVLSQDSTDLFHADHGNIGTAGAPSVAALQEGFLDMGVQTDPDDNATALNLEPQFLIVPRALRSTGRVLIGSEKDPTYDAANPGTPINEFYNALTVVSDARLDGASATAWYLAASPSQADTVEVAFLNGVEAPTVDQLDMTSPDGREFYVRLDCAAAALGYVGLWYNAGA